jgi:hypothetical protein
MDANDGVHLPRFEVFEAVPAEVLIRPFLTVLALWEEAFPHGLLFPIGLQFLRDFLFIQPFEEEQIGDLLNDFERI